MFIKLNKEGLVLYYYYYSPSLLIHRTSSRFDVTILAKRVKPMCMYLGFRKRLQNILYHRDIEYYFSTSSEALYDLGEESKPLVSPSIKLIPTNYQQND